MRVFRVAAVFVLLAAPVARAQQMPNINLMPEVMPKSDEEKAADAERDKAYKESLRKIPDSKGSSDPWGVVRGDAPKAAAKPATKTVAAKPKTRTGSNAN